MALPDTWPTLPGPDDDSYSWTEEPRVRRASFGDGYSQRSVGGLNARPRKMTLTWTNLSDTDKGTMITFLQSMAGAKGFNWTPPQESTAIKVKSERWSVRQIPGSSGPFWDVSVEFEEVFDQ
jgi:phage-related protein